MASKVLNIKGYNPLKLRRDLTGKCHVPIKSGPILIQFTVMSNKNKKILNNS